MSAGISALSGPLHGGANVQVIAMLQNIVKDGGDIKKYLAMAKDKESGFKLMGFGHRVYKNYDPRARIIKRVAHQVFDVTGRNPLIAIAVELERIALQDDYRNNFV